MVENREARKKEGVRKEGEETGERKNLERGEESRKSGGIYREGRNLERGEESKERAQVVQGEVGETTLLNTPILFRHLFYQRLVVFF